MALTLDRAQKRPGEMMAVLGLNPGDLAQQGRLAPEDLDVLVSICAACPFYDECGDFMAQGPQLRAPRYCNARVPFDELSA